MTMPLIRSNGSSSQYHAGPWLHTVKLQKSQVYLVEHDSSHAVLSTSDDSEGLPWHRVIRSDGRVAPRPSADEQIKRLREEHVEVVDGRVNLSRFQWTEQ